MTFTVLAVTLVMALGLRTGCPAQRALPWPRAPAESATDPVGDSASRERHDVALDPRWQSRRIQWGPRRTGHQPRVFWLAFGPTDRFARHCRRARGNTLPLAGLVLLAALQSVPAELHDAAKVDGATVLDRFKAVTLPWLVQPLMTVLILETLLAFRVFDLVYVLTAGGPGDATTVLSWLTYQTAFTYLDLGRGNAYAFLMALAVGLLTVMYIRLLSRRAAF